MRTPRNDPDGLTDSQDGGASERRCILTGAHGERDALLRLALSPEGAIVPDVLARAPGRGAWIGVGRGDLEISITKGKLKGALARAFKGAPAAIPADLADQVDAAFRRAFLAHLGMAAKAGVLLTGAEKIDVAARSGQVALLAHAADAAEGGRRKRDQAWRVGEDCEGSGMAGAILPVDRTALSVALGRDNAVHIALTDEGWAERLSALLDRWHRYAGWARGGVAPSARGNEPSIPDNGDGQTVAV